jgi:transcriptional regulator with XRE-family HTH domain
VSGGRQHLTMSTKMRPVDRATASAREQSARAGREIRIARTGRGLSLRSIGAATGLSESVVSRIERGLHARVTVYDLARLHAAVGLEISVRSYPGGQPIRDAAHVALLDDFRRGLHASIAWSTEVPLTIHGDTRAWDGFVRTSAWRYGIEAETAPNDCQALIRRVRQKVRDSDVDGVILVLRPTRQTRDFLSASLSTLLHAFPLNGESARAALRAGEDPGGSAVIVVPWRRKR